jgi:bacillithiol synthase
MDIQIRSMGGSRLIDDYLHDEPSIAPFFPGSPFSLQAYRQKARELRARFDSTSLAAMAPAVRTLSQGAADRLDAIVAGEGFFVTTGQQPGLFGGPLYTVHKALTAIVLARTLERLLETAVLPLFWVAADDHDLDEADHVHIVDTSNTLHRLGLRAPPSPPRSMGRRVLDQGIESTLDELAQLLPPSEFTQPLLEQLRSAYRPGETVASAFAGSLAALFDGHDLALVDGQDPVVRTLAAPVIARELEQAAAHEAALLARTRDLEAAGYVGQVTILPGAGNVFYEDDEHGRERLVRDGDGWLLRASGRRLDMDALAAEEEKHPDRFSPNVVLRPVVESAVFPTLAYVAGPGEVRYLAQTGPLFEAHEVGMPLVYPRLSVTLVERRVAKVLEKFSLGVDSFRHPVHELISAVVREDVPDAVRSALEALRGSVGQGYEAVIEAVGAVDPTLEGRVHAARADAFKGIAEVEKKVRQQVKRQQETELEQIDKAAINLAPLGKPQERVLNIHQYLARYGQGLVTELLSAMETVLAGGLSPAGAEPGEVVPAATGQEKGATR